MFSCNECAEGLKLSRWGREIHTLTRSMGECECCGEVSECGDVSCQIDACWDDDVEEQMKKMGY